MKGNEVKKIALSICLFSSSQLFYASDGKQIMATAKSPHKSKTAVVFDDGTLQIKKGKHTVLQTFKLAGLNQPIVVSKDKKSAYIESCFCKDCPKYSKDGEIKHSVWKSDGMVTGEINAKPCPDSAGLEQVQYKETKNEPQSSPRSFTTGFSISRDDLNRLMSWALVAGSKKSPRYPNAVELILLGLTEKLSLSRADVLYFNGDGHVGNSCSHTCVEPSKYLISYNAKHKAFQAKILWELTH